MCSGEAVFARCLSSLKSERVEASRVLNGPAAARYDGDRKQMVEDIKQVTNIAISFTLLQLSLISETQTLV